MLKINTLPKWLFVVVAGKKMYSLSCKLKLHNMMCTHRVDLYRCRFWGVVWVCFVVVVCFF